MPYNGVIGRTGHVLTENDEAFQEERHYATLLAELISYVPFAVIQGPGDHSNWNIPGFDYMAEKLNAIFGTT